MHFRKAVLSVLLFVCVLGFSFSAVPRCIVALSPAAAEILCAIGAYNQIAARTDASDYPPEILRKPVCGGFDGKSLSLETIVSYNPDLVYLTKGMHDHLEKPLNQLGIKTYMSNALGVQSVLDEILEVGKITGHIKEAKKVVAEIEAELKQASSITSQSGDFVGGGFGKESSRKEKSGSGNTLRAGKSSGGGNALQNSNSTQKSDSAVRVYWEVWYAPYTSAGGETFISDLITLAGGKNIFESVNSPYPIVSEESIIASMPDVILIPASEGVTSDDVKRRNGWQIIPAVKNDRIYIVDDDLFTRPGPRIGKVACALAQMIGER